MAETINTATPDYIVDGVLTDGEAWVPLVTNVLTSDAAVVTFQSSTGANDWSQYMDLVIVGYAQTDGASDVYRCQLNNDTGYNYPWQRISALGTSMGVSASTGATYAYFGVVNGSSHAALAYSAFTARFSDINSGAWKTVNFYIGADTGSGSNSYIYNTESSWMSQSAVTEIDLFVSGQDTKAGSRFDLFGVLPRMVTA